MDFTEGNEGNEANTEISFGHRFHRWAQIQTGRGEFTEGNEGFGARNQDFDHGYPFFAGPTEVRHRWTQIQLDRNELTGGNEGFEANTEISLGHRFHRWAQIDFRHQ
jgi:hypothetical protein